MIGQNYVWYHFNAASVLANAPARSGVYALFAAQRWVYVGESGDIRARLFQYLNGENDCISQWGPTGFQFEECPANQRVARQDQLILQLNPACNRRLG